MDSKTLMAAYMRAKKYTTYTEVSKDLGFTTSYIASINNERAQFTDETAIFLAKGAGLDPEEVIISLNAVRAKTPEAKAAWYSILKKYYGASAAALVLGLTMVMPHKTDDLEPRIMYIMLNTECLFPVPANRTVYNGNN